MEDKTNRNQNGASASSSRRDLITRLYERIARLDAIGQELRSTTENLEADRQRLLEENRALRRKVTLSTLVDDLKVTLTNGIDDADTIEPSAPRPVDRLYQQLPPRFSFSRFFQVASKADIETEVARRCLTYYLGEEMLAQSGAYLEKTGRL